MAELHKTGFLNGDVRWAEMNERQTETSKLSLAAVVRILQPESFFRLDQ